MPAVPNLRSPYAKVGRLVYFGRMLDKIRLHAAGKLPPEYVANLGETKPFFLDARLGRFLGVRYDELKARTLAGGADEEILAWAEARGIPRTDEDCANWNRFLTKLGWRDDRSAVLAQRVVESGLAGKGVETIFDLIDHDEGRDPARDRPWEKI
jgi:gluconokinase